MIDINQLHAIALKFGVLTKVEKDIVKEAAAEAGVEIKSTRCTSCWNDAAVEAYSILYSRQMREGQEEKQDDLKYMLKEGVDVLVCGIRVCPATMTDELGKRLERIGFPMDKYFVKYPQK